MNRTKIEWCDYTWNPIVGCTYGCSYCYARRFAKRFSKCEKCRHFIPHLHPERLEEPGRLKKPAKIFCCSMGELFDPNLSDGERVKVINAMMNAPQHIYMVLTKQPLKALDFLLTLDIYGNIPENLWVGVSVDYAYWPKIIKRIEIAKNFPTKVKFVSFEPLLRPLAPEADLKGIDWVIIGGLTGPQRFQPPKEWIDDIIYRARKAEAAVFIKDNAGYPEIIREYPQN